ncbi:MAG: VWA domain-containing protein [Phycisphaerales bacterium]
MTSSNGGPTGPGGIVHTYLGYDPKNFPSPTATPPDLAGAAFEHVLEFGSMREFTDEELANAIRLDPSMFPKLGPSLSSIAAMLKERKAKILANYETDASRKEAKANVREQAREVDPPGAFRDDFKRALQQEQIRDLEKLWYKQKNEASPFAMAILRVMERMGEQYEVEALASKYEFTGRTEMSVQQALAIKEELETIDELLEQLKQAAKDAKIAIIDMESLAEMTDPEALEDLNAVQQQIQDYLREEARRQGLEESSKGFRLSPQAYRLFQRKLLTEVFSDLEAARSGRHTGPIMGEGAVELQRTKPYEFGDPVSGLDIAQSVANAAARSRGSSRPRVTIDDLEIHRTRNSPKCATAVLMDMSGSMRNGGQYINCKRMALALDGLVRTEFPGDYLALFEMATFAKRVPISDVPALMPKPVTIFQPVVRLKADLSDPEMSERRLPQHFTNIQHALRLARQTLSVQDTPNRQVILITDGLPTAHFEGSMLFMLYPPHELTESATMREAHLCAREGITINIFLLPNWNQSHEDVQFAKKVAETTKGRVFFTGGRDLDRFVLWDYVNQRRKVIG